MRTFVTCLIWLAITSTVQTQFLYADEAVDPKQSAATADETAVRGILGRTVQGADGKDMGRIIDVIVDSVGRVRAAVIDFGGFLGVGSRKIAVDWTALHFDGALKNERNIGLALTQDQLKAAPEYKDGSPSVAIGSAGALERLDFRSVAPQEK